MLLVTILKRFRKRLLEEALLHGDKKLFMVRGIRVILEFKELEKLDMTTLEDIDDLLSDSDNDDLF